jgi:uracil-DNA glycosylase
MTQPVPDALREKIKQRLSFYEDLGIGPFYRNRSIVTPRVWLPAFFSTSTTEEESTLPKSASKTAPPAAAPLVATTESRATAASSATAAPQFGAQSSASNALYSSPIKTSNCFASLPRVDNDTLLNIREDIGDCTRCPLHKKRKHIVFADGNPNAVLVFVGEGPGADEDATGIPFVGRAGKLLTQMIEAMGLQRKDVYICNVVKCRPPENRPPEPDEVTTCSPYLVRQLEVVNPKVIVCLGATAAKTLLETDMGISKFRGQWLDFRGKKLLATYHPAYLLRNPAAKSEVWKDLQKVMAELGLEVKKAKPA